MSKSENQKLFSERRQELVDRQLSNSEAQDKAVLTLSSSGLILSISFIRYVVDLDSAEYSWLLFMSWAFFAWAVVSTICSYLVGQKAINDSIEISYKYYIDDDDDFENVIPLSAKINDFINLISSISFIIAVASIAAFISLNTIVKEPNMAKDTEGKKFITDSASIPTMQKKSANIPKQQQKPKPSQKSNKK